MEMEGRQQSEQTGELLKYIVITSVKCVLLMPLNRSRPLEIVDIKLSLCAVYSYSYLFDAAVYYRLTCPGQNPYKTCLCKVSVTDCKPLPDCCRR
jgi:hypothetical protein